jgi:hypothetical protein
MFVVPTVRFQILYVFIILALERRRLVFANVTTNPTAEWLAQQTVNAFPWDTAPRYLIRDRDKAYGFAFSHRVKGLGIREIRTAVRAPMMNAFAERVIGTLRRECFDHVIVLTEQHARHLLGEFRDWYNQDRVHLALGKDAPDHRSVEPPELGKVVARPEARSLSHVTQPSVPAELCRRAKGDGLLGLSRPPQLRIQLSPGTSPRSRAQLSRGWRFGESHPLGAIGTGQSRARLGLGSLAGAHGAWWPLGTGPGRARGPRPRADFGVEKHLTPA